MLLYKKKNGDLSFFPRCSNEWPLEFLGVALPTTEPLHCPVISVKVSELGVVASLCFNVPPKHNPCGRKRYLLRAHLLAGEIQVWHGFEIDFADYDPVNNPCENGCQTEISQGMKDHFDKTLKDYFEGLFELRDPVKLLQKNKK